MTPCKVWNQKKPNVLHLREFGCDVWVFDESQNRSKLAPRTKKMVFVGFMDGSKSIHYYDIVMHSPIFPHYDTQLILTLYHT